MAALTSRSQEARTAAELEEQQAVEESLRAEAAPGALERLAHVEKSAHERHCQSMVETCFDYGAVGQDSGDACLTLQVSFSLLRL